MAASFVVPADTVSNYVNVRAEPTVESKIIEALSPGMAATLVSESEKWFEIALADGETGYVSRFWTEKTDRISDSTQVLNAVPAAEAMLSDTGSAPDATGTLPELPAEIEPPAVADTTADTASIVRSPVEPGTQQAEPAARSASRDRRVLTEASELLKQQKPKVAYALLSGLETQWAGDTGFDYLYGVAALDSGDAVEAIFALERVVRTLPDFVGARLELARALYHDGDHERAEQAFAELLDEKPPEEARKVIQGYLDTLAAPPIRLARPQKLLYFGALGGYNSNANGAADLDSFFGFALDPQSTEQGSVFVEAQIGGLLRKPLRENIEFSWQGETNHRHNEAASFADQTLSTTALALGFRHGESTFITGVSGYIALLDGNLNEQSASLDLGWQRPIRNNALQFTVRGGPVRFDNEQNIRDVDRLLYVLTLKQPLQSGSGELRWNAIGGRDRADDRASSPYSNIRYGGQVSAQWRVAEKDLRVDLGLLRIPFNGNKDFFGIDRDDTQITSSISLELRDKPFAGWTFVPALNYVNNESNVGIFDYDRIEMNFLFRKSR